ncbi:CMD domain protein [Roseomonas marmotae]|uniref:CMD domain protein n=1 Tax=Roseomonas marmotae TaxID=2768161 RepID=A0ABS3K7H4_9PROT|nr:CMD domain protein [Roseomonas marmotae]MBO1073404.1 CMD domain protein [Roseomonas marmotae]QTI80398.1 CMD domain protein [Roseomonas marmotae]
MTAAIADVIDHLAGIAPDSPLDHIRRARPQTRENAQASYLALFAPAETTTVSLPERFAVACFVAGLHRQAEVQGFYAEGLRQAGAAPGLLAAIEAEIVAGQAEGPAGHFPAGPLSAEDSEPPRYRIPEGRRAALTPRLAAALEHAHLLVFHPRDAAPAALQALLDAGWTTPGIVTLSQLIAFLAFQLRVVLGLRALAAQNA